MITAQLDEIIGLLGGEIPKDNLITSKLNSIIAAKGGSPTENNLIGAKLRYIAELFNSNTDSFLNSEIISAIIAALGGESDSKLMSDQLNAVIDLLNNYEEASVSISYLFDNDICGNASGDIVLLADTSGNYDIMWGDASGIMANYSAINGTSIAVTESTSVTYAHLIEVNAIPKYATRVCAVQDGKIKASFTIPEEKRFAGGNYGEHLYSVELLSDVHYQYESGSEDWQKAFAFGRDRENVDAICICGDLTNYGTAESLNEWKTARDNVRGTTPVYACNGNHEVYNTSCVMIENPNAIRPYLDSDTSENGLPYFYKVINNDIYVFVACFDNQQVQNKDNVMFTDAQLTWLENLLETYRNQRVFLFQHVFPYQTTKVKVDYFGNANNVYTLNLWWKYGSTMTDRDKFLALMEHYKNVIWFSGHSHLKWILQETNHSNNYYRYKNGARLVHIPSLTVPRDIIDGSITDYIYADSEGALLDVYQNCVIIRGRNFVDEKYLGLASYLLDTTPITIEPVETVEPDEPVETVEPTVIIDATFSQEFTALGEVSNPSSVTVNDGKGTKKTVSSSNRGFVGYKASSQINKPLYYRIVGDAVGLGSDIKVGFMISKYSSMACLNGTAVKPDYAWVNTEWTKLTVEDLSDFMADETYPFINVCVKLSSSSTVTLPHTFNARIQIGYKE